MPDKENITMAGYDHRDAEGLSRLDDTRLMREYLDMQKAGFNAIFGHNARRRLNACVDELTSRGITEIPNIFGAIPVKRWDRW